MLVWQPHMVSLSALVPLSHHEVNGAKETVAVVW